MSTEDAPGGGVPPPRVGAAGGARRRAPAADGCHVVGLTGGLASGKSTVARALVTSGAWLVQADGIGHEVLEDAEAKAALAREFGPDILDATGAVRRSELGRRAFASAAALARLNAVSHPRLLARLRRALEAIVAEGFRGVVVVEAALLVEWDLGPWCDEVVAVVASAGRRREWAVLALGIPAAEVDARLAVQLPDEERVRYADRVVSNEGTLAELESRAAELARSLWGAWREREARRTGRRAP